MSQPGVLQEASPELGEPLLFSPPPKNSSGIASPFTSGKGTGGVWGAEHRHGASPVAGNQSHGRSPERRGHLPWRRRRAEAAPPSLWSPSPCVAAGHAKGGTSQTVSEVSLGPSQPPRHPEMRQGTPPKPWVVTREKLFGQLEVHKGCPKVLSSSRDGSPRRRAPSASLRFQILS